MHEFLEDLDTDSIDGKFGSTGLDVREECVEEWTCDYAICLIDIMGPTEIVYFDVDELVGDIVRRAKKKFGKSFENVRGREEAKSKQVLHVRRLDATTLEIEAYRKKG